MSIAEPPRSTGLTGRILFIDRNSTDVWVVAHHSGEGDQREALIFVKLRGEAGLHDAVNICPDVNQLVCERLKRGGAWGLGDAPLAMQRAKEGDDFVIPQERANGSSDRNPGQGLHRGALTIIRRAVHSELPYKFAASYRLRLSTSSSRRNLGVADEPSAFSSLLLR